MELSTPQLHDSSLSLGRFKSLLKTHLFLLSPAEATNACTFEFACILGCDINVMLIKLICIKSVHKCNKLLINQSIFVVNYSLNFFITVIY